MNCKFLSDVLSTSSNHTDDSQCKSEDKSENKVFVTWPRNRSVIWLCASRLLNLSTHPAKFWGNRPWGWGNMTFSNVMWLQNWSVTWLFWDLFMLSKYPVTFRVHRSYESGDTPFFVCRLTTWLMCHVILWVGSPHLKSPPCYVWGLYALWKWRYNFFICHVITISKCHVTLWVGSPHPKSLPCLVRDP